MPKTRLSVSAAATLALWLVAGCTSADTRAANSAAEAQADLDQGRITEAGMAIGKAIAARDDVADYWLLKAHIDARASDAPAAFSDYEYVMQLDHTNTEALQALCQLGTAAGPLDRVDSYADQLLVLTPASAPALAAKGNVALIRGDTDKAEAFADQVLAQDAQNVPALTLKARVMMARGKYADAAALIEQSATAPQNQSPANTVARLNMLQSIYAQSHDRAAYETTLRRLAQAAPADGDVQLAFADLLYQNGQAGQARAVIRQVLAADPASFHVAAAALNVWMNAGPQALDPATMVSDSAGLSRLMKADYAQFALETGRPALALAILRGVDQADAAAQNMNARAALAYALGVTGQRPAALAQLNAILDQQDANQPWALLARARLQAASGDYPNAVRDARLLVANDRADATAHLALADILRAAGNSELSISALREGLRANPDSARLATRLSAALAAQGHADQAAEVARDVARQAPMDLRAQHLLQIYGGGALPAG